jgi:hypothetical protein
MGSLRDIFIAKYCDAIGVGVVGNSRQSDVEINASNEAAALEYYDHSEPVEIFAGEIEVWESHSLTCFFPRAGQRRI